MNVEYEITELNRRLANLFSLGKVVETDYSGVIPKARVIIGELKTAWLDIATQRAGSDTHWWPIETGEQVLVLSISGEINQGIILFALNQNSFPGESTADIHKTQYKDGAIVQYDRAKHELKALLPKEATTILESQGGVTVTGDVTIVGSLDVSKTIDAEDTITSKADVKDKTRSMADDRDIYNEHTHPGVKSGDSSTALTTNSQ